MTELRHRAWRFTDLSGKERNIRRVVFQRKVTSFLEITMERGNPVQ